MTDIEFETIHELENSKHKDIFDTIQKLNGLIIDVHMESFTRFKYSIKCVVCVDDIKLQVICNEFGEILRVKFLGA